MVINNTSPKPDTRHATRLFAAAFSRLPLVVVVACVVAMFGGPALGARPQGPTEKPTTSKTLVAIEGVEHLDRLTREPMVVELSDGTLFVSGYDGDLERSPSLWRSRDQGATWESVNVGTKADGAIGESDVDLAVGRDDTVYFVSMTYDREKQRRHSHRGRRQQERRYHMDVESSVRKSF